MRDLFGRFAEGAAVSFADAHGIERRGVVRHVLDDGYGVLYCAEERRASYVDIVPESNLEAA